jgi:hypothetical protein
MHALVHMLKADAWPLCRDAPTWRADAIMFRVDAASMRQRIDLDRIYRQALRALPDTIDGQAPWVLARRCLWTLDELLSEEP